MSSSKNPDGPVVGMGLVNKDFVASVAAWERDRKVSATAYFEQVGGPVPVALTAIARLGTKSRIAFVGMVGADRDGDDLARLLSAQGVDASLLTRASVEAGAITSRSLVLLDERDGSRTLANYSGNLPPLRRFSPEQETLLASARLVHLDGRDLDACLRAAEIVRASGGLVSLDLGTMRPGREALHAQCDILLASRGGGAGAFPDIANAPEEQAARFLEQGAQIAGVTLAHEGVVIAAREISGGRPVRLRPFRVAKVTDTCGAGDTFHGAFLWAFLQGWEPVACADWAQAAVALRITRLGNQAGLPTRAEVAAFLASNPPRG